MKKLFLSLIMLTVIGVSSAFAQTNVSGGIYSSTTWTLAGSPYIVTDTVVVFPGVTLTIEPGVTVKFDNGKMLELRQAKIIAIGTSIDSITFTSNSTSPTPGIWGEVYYNGGTGTSNIIFDFCNFRYANIGLNYESGDTAFIKNSSFFKNDTGLFYTAFAQYFIYIDTTNFLNNLFGITGELFGIINHCNISNNNMGIYGQGWSGMIKNCIVNSNQTGIEESGCSIFNCKIINNQTGLNHGEGKIENCYIKNNSVEGIIAAGDSVINCQILNNGIGFSDWGGLYDPNVITKNVIDSNSIGIQIGGSRINKVYCNKICSNTSYDLYYNTTGNANFPNNYWCTTDSASNEAVIYDGYDNISLGLVSFMPIDTIACYLTTGIAEIISSLENNISIYPNPATDNLTIDVSATLNIPATIEITNIEGQVIKQQTTNVETTNLNVSALAKGMYFVKVKTEKGVAVKKFIKE